MLTETGKRVADEWLQSPGEAPPGAATRRPLPIRWLALAAGVLALALGSALMLRPGPKPLPSVPPPPAVAPKTVVRQPVEELPPLPPARPAAKRAPAPATLDPFGDRL